MRYVHYFLVIAAVLALTACGKKTSNPIILGIAVMNLNGGNGGSGAGGKGGSISTLAAHGDVRFNATLPTFSTIPTIPSTTPNLGSNPATITTNTLVGSSASSTAGDYYVLSGDHNLYLVNNALVGVPVTGLTVNAGATLSLPNVNVFTLIPQAVVINGTVTNSQNGETLDLRSGSSLVVNGGGKVATTPTVAGTDSGLLKLSSGGILLNGGTVESNGGTGSGGNSDGVSLEAGTFLYNIGTITASGDGVGNGGPVQLQADTASIYTGPPLPSQTIVTGTIDASGGNDGGNGGAITLVGGSATNVGQVVVAGPVTSNGGAGPTGNGGAGGAITITSFSGAVQVAANISAIGGQGIGSTSNGGKGGSLLLIDNVGNDTANQHQLSPVGIMIYGNISLNGGAGGAGAAGGDGGALSFSSDFASNALPGFASVQFFGYQSVTLNGGNSTGGNGGDGGTVSLAVSASNSILGVNYPAGGVYNEVTISAIGGDNTPKSSGSSGGKGGSLQFVTPLDNGASDPARTLVSNSGSIYVSGGGGDIGGGQGNVTMASFGNLTNTGYIVANGGLGGAQGGGIPAAANPSQNIFVSLSSSSSLFNSGIISVVGGNGSAGGNAGGVVLASGNQTSNSAAIVASGGASTAAGNGGNGGFISLTAELAYFPTVGSLNVAKGSGGPANTGTVGTILIGGVDVTSATGVI